MPSRLPLFTLLFLALVFAVVQGWAGEGTLFQVTAYPGGDAAAPQVSAGGGEAFAVYFSDPGNGNRGGPDAALAEAIRAARVSVEMAVYELNLWSLRDALLAAQARGLTVRLVAETSALDSPEMQALAAAGIPIRTDDRPGLMHDKFAILDRSEVWAGSLNYTLSGAYQQDNNLLRIRAEKLAANYLAEFEEMFTEGKFGPGSPANTPYPSLTIAGIPVEVYFSPDDGVARHVLPVLRAAQESIAVLAFSFTSDDLAAALIERARAGVEVRGVFDESQVNANTGGEFDALRQAGLAIYLDGNQDKMHHKVIVIDGKIVITGSYNFSGSAETRNDENLLIIHSPALAAQYLAEFERVLAQARK